MLTRSICYLLPVSMINWATLLKMTAFSYLKTIRPLSQLCKTKSKYTADCEAFSKITGLAIKDKGT